MDRNEDFISMPMGNETTDNAVNRVLPQMQQTAQRLRKLLWKISGMDRS
jgi:hypothetical protein